MYNLLWIGPAGSLARKQIDRVPDFDVTWVRDTDEALAVPSAPYSAAVYDAGAGPGVVAQIQRLATRRRFPPLVVCVEDGSIEWTSAALAAGARDVLAAQPELEHEWIETLRQSLARLSRSARRPPQRTPSGLVVASRAMREVVALAERAANSSATVLIRGETGAGKEGIARAAHELGPRAGEPFVAVNCAAFPDTLLESELFGYSRGAFTGAERDKRGLFEQAGKGTLFLDEIGETSGPLQAKLLRALQEREVRPVGSPRARKVACRVVAASNRDLRSEAASGFFRQDLYYRLAVFPIAVPPLRERREDVLPLAKHFLEQHGAREDKRGCHLSPAAEHLLLAHAWPGNVRELENEIQRALALAESGETLGPAHLSASLALPIPLAGEVRHEGESLRASVERIEAVLIREALARNGAQRKATAADLGLTREGLFKKMKRLGID